MYVWHTISSCYRSIPLALVLIVRDGGLSALCHSCGLDFQQRVLKTFPGSGYLHSLDRVDLLWQPLLNLYIWLTISSCYSSIPLVFGLIVRDADLSTLCHGWEFFCQQRLLKTFPGPGYFPWEDGVVWLSHPLVNWRSSDLISPCYGSIPLGLELIVRDAGLSTLCHSSGLTCH